MAESIAIDTRDITITPVFRWQSFEDVNQSERAGSLVKKMIQVVEVRFAGTRNYAPVFPVDAVWKRENGKSITYAERWSEQYRAFLEGNAQEAAGTPLEMLRSFGITEAHLSLCRALKIYSIEALYHLEGDALKSLGMLSNTLKKMARDFMAAKEAKAGNLDELEALRAEIEALKAGQVLAKAGAEPQTTEVVQPIVDDNAVDEALAAAQSNVTDAAANDRFDTMDDAALKAFIKDKSGSAPRGTPSRQWLLTAARELAA